MATNLYESFLITTGATLIRLDEPDRANSMFRLTANRFPYESFPATGATLIRLDEPEPASEPASEPAPDLADPMFHLTAHRFPLWKLRDMKIAARYRITDKGERWNSDRKPRLNRFSTRNVRLEVVPGLSDVVMAHRREPDRIDILGDLYMSVMLVSRHMIDIDGFLSRMFEKFPTLRAFRLAVEKFGRGGWTPPNWVRATPLAAGNYELCMSSDRHAYNETLPYIPGHLVHVSVDDPLKVAYVKSVRDLLRGYNGSSSTWVTRTTPGRYLKANYPHLSELEIREFANLHTKQNQPVEVKVARSESECIRAIAEGPSESCMCNKRYDGRTDDNLWYNGHIHPAAIYGYDEDDPTWDTDVEVLYFEDNGKIKARVICNKLTKACARIYGDADKLKPAIERMGYHQARGALVGCRVRRIENENGDGYIMAYIDAGTRSGGGALAFKHSGDDRWWITTDGEGESTNVGYERRGTTGYIEEEECECSFCGAVGTED